MSSQHLLSELITEVAEFCRARRGRVTQLAADLGVSQPHVSLWLSRRQEPSGARNPGGQSHTFTHFGERIYCEGF